MSQFYGDAKYTLGQYLDLARPYNASAALLSFVLGYYFYHPTDPWFNLVIGLVVVAFAHSAFTMQNDLCDLDVDRTNHRITPLISGQIKQATLRQVIFNILLVSLAIAWFSSEKLVGLVFVLTYAFGAWLYNSPPIAASRRPLSSIALLGLLYGLGPLLFGFLLGGHAISSEFLLFCGFATMIRMSISLLKDFKDAAGDRLHHKRTFYLTFGRKSVVFISTAVAAMFYPLIVILLLRHAASELPLILAGGLCVAAAISVLSRFRLIGVNSVKRLTKIFQQSFIGENYFALVILLCLISS